MNLLTSEQLFDRTYSLVKEIVKPEIKKYEPCLHRTFLVDNGHNAKSNLSCFDELAVYNGLVFGVGDCQTLREFFIAFHEDNSLDTLLNESEGRDYTLFHSDLNGRFIGGAAYPTSKDLQYLINSNNKFIIGGKYQPFFAKLLANAVSELIVNNSAKTLDEYALNFRA